MASSASLTEIEKGEAAHTAIKRNMPSVIKGVIQGSIPPILYSQDLISEETWELLQRGEVIDSRKGTAIAVDVQTRVRNYPDMLDVFCKILSGEFVTKDIAEAIHVTYEKDIQSKLAASHECREPLNELIRELEMLKIFSRRPECPREQSIDDCIKGSIRHYIDASTEDVSISTLKSELATIHSNEVLITREVYNWAIKEVQSTKEEISATRSMAVAESKPRDTPSLYDANTLYHAALCSCAVTVSKNEEEAHRYFGGEANHKITQVSVCAEIHTEELDRYLIARNGNVIYVAFQSETKLSQWPKKYNNFEEGIEKQTDKVPVHFFLEQMLKDQKIVLTGFSFGGLLACSIAAKLCRTTLDPDLLQRNLCCITFGQPLIAIPFVQKTVQMFPYLEKAIHLIFDKDDVIPGLMHYHTVGCSLGTPIPKIDFCGEFSSEFLSSVSTLQKVNASYSKVHEMNRSESSAALSKIKAMLSRILQHFSFIGGLKFDGNRCGLIGQIHTMVIEGKEGLTGKDVSVDIASEMLLGLDQSQVENMDIYVFKKHKMEFYRTAACQVLLPKFVVPYGFQSSTLPSPNSVLLPIQSVEILKPILHSVEFHVYPNQHIVVIKGDNMWFSHKIELGVKKVMTIKSPTNVMRRSVQYNFPPTPKTKKLAACENLRVCLKSQFCEEIKKDIETTQEPYVFTLRQKQLAKHTPTELIKLAYYIAMLERPVAHSESSIDQPMSKRFEAVVKYLEEVAKIVPLESVFHAIAHSDDDTALKCSRALQSSSSLDFPASQLMVVSSSQAADRLLLGKEYVKQYLQAQNCLPVPRVQTTSVVQEKGTFMLQPSLSQPSRRPQQAASVNSAGLSQKPRYSDITRASRTPHFLRQDVRQIVEIPVPMLTVEPCPLDENLGIYIDKLWKQISTKCRQLRDHGVPVLSRKSIEHFCQFSLKRESASDTRLKSPLKALIEARKQLLDLVNELSLMQDVRAAIDVTKKLAQEVKDIQNGAIKICAALLAAFMEQQIQIPLLSSHISTAAALSRISSVVMGAWAFVSMGLVEISQALESSEGQLFKIEIEDYIDTVLQRNSKQSQKSGANQEEHSYANKLRFLVGGIKVGPVVTCSEEYISYSLERQLKKLSEELKFNETFQVNHLVSSWDIVFKKNALSLVAKTHRPLIARWLKWSLLTHNLREVLASHLCIAVIGISNSGKSLLVNSLFKTKAQVGTTQSKKTVVPFLYNMDGKVDNLDVVDFPGIDDKDGIPELMNLLVSLAQVVVCVLSYKNVNSKSLVELLQPLEKEDIPVLLCITHGDCLCADICSELTTEDGKDPNIETMRHRLELELKATTEVLSSHHVPSRTLMYFCFNKQQSNLSVDELQSLGVFPITKVGTWLVDTIRDKLDQPAIATRLQTFLQSSDTDTAHPNV